jgi:hypothetical protein
MSASPFLGFDCPCLVPFQPRNSTGFATCLLQLLEFAWLTNTSLLLVRPTPGRDYRIASQFCEDAHP